MTLTLTSACIPAVHFRRSVFFLYSTSIHVVFWQGLKLFSHFAKNTNCIVSHHCHHYRTQHHHSESVRSWKASRRVMLLVQPMSVVRWNTTKMYSGSRIKSAQGILLQNLVNSRSIDISILTRENVGRANAENFIAFRSNGRCERAIENRRVRITSTPQGQSICWTTVLLVSTMWAIHFSFFPSQLHSYSLSDVCTLWNRWTNGTY